MFFIWSIEKPKRVKTGLMFVFFLRLSFCRLKVIEIEMMLNFCLCRSNISTEHVLFFCSEALRYPKLLHRKVMFVFFLPRSFSPSQNSGGFSIRPHLCLYHSNNRLKCSMFGFFWYALLCCLLFHKTGEHLFCFIPAAQIYLCSVRPPQKIQRDIWCLLVCLSRSNISIWNLFCTFCSLESLKFTPSDSMVGFVCSVLLDCSKTQLKQLYVLLLCLNRQISWYVG